MKNTLRASMVAAFILIAQLANAQAAPAKKYGLGQGETPAIEVPVNFQVFRANAPPKDCGCFWMYGGGGGLVLNFTRHWSGVADLLRARADNINGTNQHLTIFNYQVGPRYSFRTHSRYTPYGQALVGGSEVFSNYNVYGQGRNFFSSTVGGGVNMRLTNHIGVTLAEGSWMFSQAVNGVNTRQNNLKLTTGIIFRFPPR